MRAKRLCMGMTLSVLVALASFISLAQPVAPLGIIIQPPDASDLSIRIWVDRGAYTVGEKVNVHFEVNAEAYVYIYDIDPAGKVTPLFPNAWSQNNRVSAGEHTLPDSAAYWFKVSGPPGTDYIQAIACTQPLSIPSQFQSTTPFAPLGLDPEDFQSQYQARVLGIVPAQAWAQDWTSFEVVSGSAPSYGAVIVNSIPSGAWITLDGDYVGYTPRTLYLRQGSHQIALSKSGYEDWRRVVSVIGGLTRTINARLESIAPVNQPPIASFIVSPGFSTWVHFDASTSTDPDGSILSYRWDFGDGKSGSGVSDWHWYSGPGTYTVVLTVADDDGSTDTEIRPVQVGPTNQPPIASYTVTPPSPAVSEWVRFDASASSDGDGTIVSYRWDFGNGRSSSQASDWTRYTFAGTYTVTLAVTDDDGATDTEVRTIQVGPTNQPPIASFTFTPPSPAVSEWVRFDASASSDGDGTIVSYRWDFGNGRSSSQASDWTRYTFAGTYTVTLAVTDDDGATDTEVRTIQVGPTNQPPVASFSYSPPNPTVGAQVLFNANTSYDPDGGIVSYRWNFGDGSISGPSATSAGYHPFTRPGTYTVTLTVTDDDGATDTEVRTIQIGPTNQPPVAAFTYSPTTPGVGEQIVLNAATSYDPDGMIVSYSWDLDGDGSDDTSGQIAAVPYYSLGVYPIRLTVTDNTGLSSVATQWITVGGAPGVPGGPAMGGTPGIFVWGTDTWHVTVNAGSTWTSTHAYRLELRTDGSFQNVNQSTSGGVAPLGIVPTPTAGGKTLLFEGNLQSGSLDYTFATSGSRVVWMSLQLDMDSDGNLEESPSFVYLRSRMVNPPSSRLPFSMVSVAVPFALRVTDGYLSPSSNFSVCYTPSFGEGFIQIYWACIRIEELEGLY